MTYCVGVKLNKGLVFMSDTLTNAGVDNLSHHKKMFHWHLKKKCIFTLLASGNLATTQSVVNKINESNKKINNTESILNHISIPIKNELSEIIVPTIKIFFSKDIINFNINLDKIFSIRQFIE